MRNLFVSDENPHGQPNAEILRQLEEHMTRSRMIELAANPLDGSFDYAHMKAIHRYIFQDVYEWAGEERTAPIGQRMYKDGHAYYPAGPALTAAANKEYEKIAAADFLRGLDREEFVTELAERWGELNVIHSFREGNTRSQFIFFAHLCEQAGHPLDTSAFKESGSLRDEFIQARFHSQRTGRNDRLASVLEKALEPATSGGELPRQVSKC